MQLLILIVVLMMMMVMAIRNMHRGQPSNRLSRTRIGRIATMTPAVDEMCLSNVMNAYAADSRRMIGSGHCAAAAPVRHIEQCLWIANEFVHIPFAYVKSPRNTQFVFVFLLNSNPNSLTGHLLHDAFFVVVAQAAR